MVIISLWWSPRSTGEIVLTGQSVLRTPNLIKGWEFRTRIKMIFLVIIVREQHPTRIIGNWPIHIY